MGFLSKVWKGIKKTVKKIGKGIKKVFGKVMKGIGKLGIVGQIGMMFLMPYAMGALGSLFGTAGKLASWSTKLLGPNANFLQKALGKTLEMINVGGTWVKNAYTSVSTAISNGIDRVGNFFKTGEFKLSADRSSVFSADFKDSLDTLPTQSGIKADQLKAEQLKAQQLQAAQDARLKEGIEKALEKPTGQMVLKDGKYVYESNFKPGEINLDSLKISPENLTQKMNYGDTGDLLNKVLEDSTVFEKTYQINLDSIKLDGQYESLLGGTPGKKGTGNFFQDINIFDKDSAIRKDIRDFDIYDAGKQQVFDGVMGGLETEAYYAISPDSRPKTPIYNDIRIPNVMGIGSSSGRGVFDTVSLLDVQSFAAPRGNAWQANSMYSTGLINSYLNPNEGDSWKAYMNNFAYQNAMR